MKSDTQYIFNAKNTDTSTKTETETAYYTIIGNQDFIDHDNKPRLNKETSHALAKFQNKKYYIRVGTHNRIFNPIGLFSEGKANNFISTSGKQEYPFRQVNKEIFDLYINFLSTKNIAWLNNAERGLV